VRTSSSWSEIVGVGNEQVFAATWLKLKKLNKLIGKYPSGA